MKDKPEVMVVGNNLPGDCEQFRQRFEALMVDEFEEKEYQILGYDELKIPELENIKLEDKRPYYRRFEKRKF